MSRMEIRLIIATLCAIAVGGAFIAFRSHGGAVPLEQKRVTLRSDESDYIPIAPKDVADLTTFFNAGPPAYLNGQAVGPSDTQTLINMRGSGRILMIASGTHAVVLRTEDTVPFVEITEGPDKGSQGWVAVRHVTGNR